MIKGNLKIDFSRQISQCGENIDQSIKKSERLKGLTEDQKNAISDIIHMELLNKFDDFNLDIFGDNNE
tara:strand:- start:4779 stop:4982 length:204 start_codon:yes stop_codon:yes gene_type:complete